MKPFLSILSLLLTLTSWAQTFRGKVTDAATHKPLSHVAISSWERNKVTESDSNGNFSFTGEAGTFYFILEGYTVLPKNMTSEFTEVEMAPLSITLKDVTITPYAGFQSDSAEMANLYGKELGREAIKPKVYPGTGLVAEGVISSVAQNFSKKAKQAKRFKEDFRKDMEQKFVDIRYTPGLVASLTDLKGESISQFMAAYPMEHEFARAASDLEIKAWIRQNYRTYAGRKKS